MLKFHVLTRSVVMLGLFMMSCAGCGGSSTPQATSEDELSQYLDAHPELKEEQVETAPSDPRESN